MDMKKTAAALSVAAIAATTIALPAAAADAKNTTGVQIATCSPCAAKKASNPCAAKKASCPKPCGITMLCPELLPCLPGRPPVREIPEACRGSLASAAIPLEEVDREIEGLFGAAAAEAAFCSSLVGIGGIL